MYGFQVELSVGLEWLALRSQAAGPAPPSLEGF
jgi:hypothetical protein